MRMIPYFDFFQKQEKAIFEIIFVNISASAKMLIKWEVKLFESQKGMDKFLLMHVGA